jgi:hypothetical protein
MEIRQPQTEITLKVAQEADQRIWVYEDHETVRNMVIDATREGTALITFSRVQGIGNPGIPFSTKPNNVTNVRDISE